MKVIGAQRRKFSPGDPAGRIAGGQEQFRSRSAARRKQDYYKTFQARLSRGREYPHLVRDERKPDLLSDISSRVKQSSVVGLQSSTTSIALARGESILLTTDD